MRRRTAIAWLVLVCHLSQVRLYGWPTSEPTPSGEKSSITSPLVLQISTAETPDPLNMTLTVGAAEDAAGVSNLVQLVQRQLAEAKAQNPEFQLEVVGVAEDAAEQARLLELARPLGDETPAVEVLPRSWFTRLQEGFRSWVSQAQRPYRLTFALTQFSIEGVASTATLTISERIPLEIAATMGVLLGSISAGFLYKSRTWRSFVMDAGWARKLLGIAPQAPLSTWVENVEALGKWLIIDGTIVAIAWLAMTMLGVPPKAPEGPLMGFASVVAADFAAEFPWEMAILTHNRQKKKDSPEEADTHIDFRTDQKLLGLSVLGAVLTAAQLANVPFAHWAIGLSSAAGLYVYTDRVRWPGLFRRCLRWVMSSASSLFGDRR